MSSAIATSLAAVTIEIELICVCACVSCLQILNELDEFLGELYELGRQ